MSCILLSFLFTFCPVQLEDKRVTIQVFQSEVGGPIAGAPVRLEGLEEQVVTDDNGIAVFAGIPIDRFERGNTKVIAHPKGHAPVCREVDFSAAHPFLTLQAPLRGGFKTGLIIAATGGTYSFHGNLGHSDQQFEMTLQVPTQTVSENFRVELAWYGVQSAYLASVPKGEVFLGGIELRVFTQEGALITDQLGKPLSIAFEPMGHWGLADLGVDDAETLRFQPVTWSAQPHGHHEETVIEGNMIQFKVHQSGIYHAVSAQSSAEAQVQPEVSRNPILSYRDSTFFEAGKASSGAGWGGMRASTKVLTDGALSYQLTSLLGLNGPSLARTLLSIQAHFSGSVAWSKDGGFEVLSKADWGDCWESAGDLVAPPQWDGSLIHYEVGSQLKISMDGEMIPIAKEWIGSVYEFAHLTETSLTSD